MDKSANSFFRVKYPTKKGRPALLNLLVSPKTWMSESLGLMTHVTGHIQIRRLACHGSSWRTQASHGHPSFSPDDRSLIYNSDVDNRDNVCMADARGI
jgi:hypothetical protein